MTPKNRGSGSWEVRLRAEWGHARDGMAARVAPSRGQKLAGDNIPRPGEPVNRQKRDRSRAGVRQLTAELRRGRYLGGTSRHSREC